MADIILACVTFDIGAGPIQNMYKVPILNKNLIQMDFVWKCLDLQYGLGFDTKHGFYQFAANANVDDNDWIQVCILL